MKDKILVSKDYRQVEVLCEDLNKGLECIKQVSDGKVTSLNIDALNKLIMDNTGYQNVLLATKFLDIEFEHNLISIASNLLRLNSDKVVKIKGTYKPRKSYINQVEKLNRAITKIDVIKRRLKQYKNELRSNNF